LYLTFVSQSRHVRETYGRLGVDACMLHPHFSQTF
jgi:hypothetical protein